MKLIVRCFQRFHIKILGFKYLMRRIFEEMRRAQLCIEIFAERESQRRY